MIILPAKNGSQGVWCDANATVVTPNWLRMGNGHLCFESFHTDLPQQQLSKYGSHHPAVSGQKWSVSRCFIKTRETSCHIRKSLNHRVIVWRLRVIARPDTHPCEQACVASGIQFSGHIGYEKNRRKGKTES